MTCYFDPSQGTFDAYDHNGDLVTEGREIRDSWSVDEEGRLVEAPQDFLDALREAMDGNQPSAYNQAMLSDLATSNFREGTPPEQ